MKRILLTLLLFIGISPLFAQGKADKFKTYKVKTSAVCEMCKNTLEKNLVFEKGVRLVTLELETNMLTFEYNPKKTDESKLREAVNELGYDAGESPADDQAYEKLHGCCKKEMGAH